MLTTATMARLSNAFCSWASKTELSIDLVWDATIQIGDALAVQCCSVLPDGWPSGCTPSDVGCDATSPPSVTLGALAGSETFLTPTASFVAPQIPSCGSFSYSLDAYQSAGGGLHNFQWSVVVDAGGNPIGQTADCSAFCDYFTDCDHTCLNAFLAGQSGSYVSVPSNLLASSGGGTGSYTFSLVVEERVTSTPSPPVTAGIVSQVASGVPIVSIPQGDVTGATSKTLINLQATATTGCSSDSSISLTYAWSATDATQAALTWPAAIVSDAAFLWVTGADLCSMLPDGCDSSTNTFTVTATACQSEASCGTKSVQVTGKSTVSK